MRKLFLLIVLLIGSCNAFAQVITIFPPSVVPAGTIGPSSNVTIAASPNFRTLILHILSSDWTTGEAGLVINFNLDLSVDGGATWCPQGPVYCVTGTTQGGAVSHSRVTGLDVLPDVAMDIPANVAVTLRARATLNKTANSLGLGYEIVTH
jgi:hypothetical protein